MKKSILYILAIFHVSLLSAGIVEKTFYFSNPRIETTGDYQTLSFGNALLSGLPGEPMLPYCEVVLMLPPGESAASIDILEENEIALAGLIMLKPAQQVRPVSMGSSGEFLLNEKVYQRDGIYPGRPTGQLITQYLNGYAFALSTFTPVRYNPAKRKLTYYQKVTIRINTHSDPESGMALNHLPVAENMLSRVRAFAQNPDMMTLYPRRNAPLTSYQYLIISPVIFKNEFQPLISMYNVKGISSRVVTIDSISTYGTGWDLNEKIRNFIISEHQNHNIEYVLLAGNPPLVPYRGFYCYVISGAGYSDPNIPSDLYFSGLDGNYDANGNHIFGEVADNPDLLPDIAVGRFPVNDTAELHRMLHKIIAYQTNPIPGELSRPLLVGEYLWASPLTFGSNYMNLLINNHNDNGYFTHGIPSSMNNIEKLYDTLISATPFSVYYFSTAALLAKINSGRSFIHHLGHGNSSDLMRLSTYSITNQNFNSVNGIIHNYQLIYSQACDCGAFDVAGGCIGAKSVTINNFLAGGIFNTRYGWFDEGTTEGPSQHLEREFVSALYTDTLPERHLGTVHMISKIKTAPWVTLPGEFEPGAQRWCHYDCSVLGDPAMEIWTEEPAVFTDITWTGALDSDWNKAGNWSPAAVPGSVFNVIIPDTQVKPVITTISTTFCHDLTIQSGGNLTINPGKSMVVYGDVMLQGEAP